MQKIRASRTPSALLIAALLLASACTAQPKATPLAATNSLQISSTQWDMAVAAPTAARASNNGLIMMR